MWKWNVIKKKLGLTRTLTTIGLIEYDREKLLGQGTFGKVYHGEYAGIEVAVKKVLIYRSKSFLTEEEALKKIDHPNVIKLFHCESDLDFRYYALQLCACSMDQLFLPETNYEKYERLLPPQKDVLIQLFKGLDYIHCDARLVHRDIKPGNVLISLPTQSSAKSVIKWADFGLSKALQGSKMSYTPSDVYRGTYYWMAPEIYKAIRGQNPNYRGTIKSDIFSVACVAIYFLLKGSHPFGPLVDEVVPNYVIADSPVHLHKLELGHFARDTIVKMLAPLPEDRITLEEAIHDLESIKAEVDDVPADFNRENECDDDDDDYEVRRDGAGAVPIVNMNDNPADSINFTGTDDGEEIDKEIREIEAEYAGRLTDKELTDKIREILHQKHPKYCWMAVVSPGEHDCLVVTNPSTPRKSFIHFNVRDGKYDVFVFRTMKKPTNRPNKDSPSFITTVKGAFNWAQHVGFNTPKDVLNEAKKVYTEIQYYHQIIVKIDEPVPWLAGGFSFFKDTIGSYYVFLIEVP